MKVECDKCKEEFKFKLKEKVSGQIYFVCPHCKEEYLVKGR